MISFIIAACILIYSAWVIKTQIKKIKKGQYGCGGDCSSCSQCSGCHKQ